MKKLVPVVVLVAFSILSAVLAFDAGLGGLAALRSGWSLQVTLDLCISLFLVGGWIRRDARQRGIDPRPYLVALPFLGSIGALAYLVRRNVLGAGARARIQEPSSGQSVTSSSIASKGALSRAASSI
jgi:hypothetical protein